LAHLSHHHRANAARQQDYSELEKKVAERQTMDDGHGRARCTATIAMATPLATKNQKNVIASKVAPANFFSLFQCQKQ
jgi:hypothetical protein